MPASRQDPVKLSVAVTGMNAADNPAPGVAVARSLRHEQAFQGRIVGLGYDALDAGFYAQGLLDAAMLLPYPSSGREALLSRLRRARDELGVEVLLPTLDSELRILSAAAGELEQAGIRTFLPSAAMLQRASKPELPALARTSGIAVPESHTVTSVEQLQRRIAALGLPVVVKGLYYGATVVHSEVDALAAFHRYAAEWGVPVVLQQHIAGDEYNVAALGDGRGNVVGAVAMRKLMITDKGKGWCGVTLRNPELERLAEAVVGALRWRGGLEIEVLKDRRSGTDYIIEINPRFPAWVYLAAAAGQNLPYANVRLAAGLPVAAPLPPYRAGLLFVRIAVDQIAELRDFERLSTAGLIVPAQPQEMA